MKLALCQYAEGQSRDQLAVTREIHQSSCDRFGYTYVCPQHLAVPKGIDPHWKKAYMLRQAAKQGFDKLVWLDADTLWLGEQPLEPEDIDLVGVGLYDHTNGSFNTGAIYLNTRHPQAVQFLDDWIASPVIGHIHHDQAGFNKLVGDGKYRPNELLKIWNFPLHAPMHGRRPIVIAWHGYGDNRAWKMQQYLEGEHPGLHVDVRAKDIKFVLQNWFNRKQLRRVINLLDAKKVVEVGVHKGDFLNWLSEDHMPGCKFYGVDKWQVYDGYEFSRDCTAHAGALAQAKEVAYHRFAGSNVELICGESSETHGLEGLDLVYIDANHEEEFAARDMDAWWDKIRPGGVLAGHDYDHPGLPGAAKAVDAFVAKHNLVLYKALQCYSWAVIKPLP